MHEKNENRLLLNNPKKCVLKITYSLPVAGTVVEEVGKL
jgi:hypothetical protein